MPEQPQWSERTLDMPPQDPWADAPTAPAGFQGPAKPQPPTAYQPPSGPTPTRQQPAAGPAPTRQQPVAPQPPAGPPQAPFSQGRAQVSPKTQPLQAEHEPTGTGWPGAAAPEHHDTSVIGPWSEIRGGGGEWTSAAVLFAFVSWGIWALSAGGPLGTPVIVFLVTLAVAAGVFCLARIIGHLVLERQMGRSRRSARGSHLVTALFLAGVGIAHLQQTEWVMTAWNWVADQAR
jgi:hypothetical protein